MDNSLIIGADIGGSHISAAYVDMQEKKVKADTRKRKQVNSAGTTTEIIDEWVKLIKEVRDTNPVKNIKIGIALPGPFDYENGIALIQNQAKYDSLYRRNVKYLLKEYLQVPPENIILTNDASSFLQGECFKSFPSVTKAIGVTLGTGLGTAKINNGVGSDANLWCSRYKDGIAEDYISTRWFLKRFLELTGESLKDVKELSALYSTNEKAVLVFKEFGQNLGAFLESFIKAENPELVIIGGNISKASDLFLPVTKEYLSGKGITVPVEIAELGEDATILGAASLFNK